MDPCDLRLKGGDAAVREFVARRVPLYRFVLANVASRYDLDRADGRIDALREAAKLVSSIRDRSKVEAFSRELAQMLGVDVEEARAEVRRATGRPRVRRSQPSAKRSDYRGSGPEAPQTAPLPDLRDPRFSIERETLKLVVQFPESVGAGIREVGVNDFTHPTYRAVWEVIVAAGGAAHGVGDPSWAARLQDASPDQAASSAISALGVEGLLTAKEPDAAYVAAHVYRLQELTAMRRIAEVKSKLQRTNPVEQADRLQPDVRGVGRAGATPTITARVGGGRLVSRLTSRRLPRPDVEVWPRERFLPGR